MALNVEYLKVIDGLIDRFEFLQRAGIYFIPAGGSVNETPRLNAFGNPAAGLVILSDVDIASDEAHFTGPSGKLLADIINAMKFGPEEVYVISGVKSASSGGKQNTLCALIANELSKLTPKVIVAFGQASANALAGFAPMTPSASGPFLDWKGTKVLQAPCLEEMLENKDLKRKAWSYLQTVMKEFGKTPA